MKHPQDAVQGEGGSQTSVLAAADKWCLGAGACAPLLPYGLYGNFEMEFFGAWILPKERENAYSDSLANINSVCYGYIYNVYIHTTS